MVCFIPKYKNFTFDSRKLLKVFNYYESERPPTIQEGVNKRVTFAQESLIGLDEQFEKIQVTNVKQILSHTDDKSKVPG